MTAGSRQAATPPPALVARIAEQCARPVPSVLTAFVDVLSKRFGDGLSAVLLYGSCLHNDDPREGIVDLYAVVDDYRTAYPGPGLRLLNALLPPNVFYVEAGGGPSLLRAKYAVISEEHLRRGTSRWFHSYLWARCAQPMRLLHVRDQDVRRRVHEALAQAVITFLEEAVPALERAEVHSDELWVGSLALSYAAELRPERGRAHDLVRVSGDDYVRLTAAAAPALEGRLEALDGDRFVPRTGEGERVRALRRWRLRRWQGRALSILRLSKALFTFENGVDYALWKVERHTGVKVEVTPRMRRFPLLAGPVVVWKLIRRGTLR